jgi:hypothetical protein
VFFVTSREKHNCPDCGGKLSGHGKDNRHIKNEHGEKEWYQISRTKCQGCKRTHSMLPDFMLPYKHYQADIIESVIDEVDPFFAIEESTIYRWKKWYRWIQDQLNSNLRAVRQAEERLFYSKVM